MAEDAGTAIDLGGAQDKAAAVAAMERQLGQLIDEAGELSAARAAADNAYQAKRQSIEALMDQLGVTRSDGTAYKATRKARREKHIDALKLFRLVGEKRAAACVNVVLSRAEQALTAKQWTKLLEYQEGAVVLTIKRLDTAE